MDTADLRTPPNSYHSEAALIGGLMLDNARFDEVADLVTAADFYRPEHRELFAALCDRVLPVRLHEIPSLAR